MDPAGVRKLPWSCPGSSHYAGVWDFQDECEGARAGSNGVGHFVLSSSRGQKGWLLQIEHVLGVHGSGA